MTKRKTHQEFVEEVYNLVGNEYTVLSEYKNSSTHVLIRHNKCGNEYYVIPNNFTINNRRCRNCMNKQMSLTKMKTDEKYKSEIMAIYGDEYAILEEYKGNKNKIKIKHNKCGYVYSTYPYSLLEGFGCKKCSMEIVKEKQKKSDMQFSAEVSGITNGEYEVTGNYINARTKISIKHNRCGYEYFTTPTNGYLTFVVKNT